jgi:hypothetical protein
LYYSGYSVSKGVVLGMVSGIVSSILVFLILGRIIPPVSGVRGFYPVATVLGSALVSRIVIGLVVGGIFGAIAAKSRHAASAGKIVALGIVVGIVTWILLSVLGVVVYDMMSGGLPSSTMMMYLIYSFIRYFVFGLILGALVGFLLPRYRATTVVQRERPMAVTQEIQGT